MKFSKYNFLFDVDNGTYLYNLLSTALIEIDDSVKQSVELNNLELLPKSYLTDLKQMHYIVDDLSDEVAEYMYYFNSIKYRLAAKSFGLIFIPTYSCNLACPYCLQGQNKSKDIISEEALNSVLSFSEKKIEASKKSGMNVEKINASIFGGEPLMAKQMVYGFCEGMTEIARYHDCSMNFLMTTNGTLIDDSVIELIEKYKIGIQISIDGSKSQHDKTRIRRDGKGTYDNIVENLKKLNDKGLKDNIVIRLNTDVNSIVSAEETLREMRQYANDVYFGFLSDFKGFNDGFDTCLDRWSYSEIMTTTIYPLLEKYGLKVYRTFGKMSPCTICTENRYVIDANLDVYKCEVLVNQQDAKVGTLDLSGNIVYNNNFYKHMAISPDKNAKCRECKLLPLCGGGCVGRAYVNQSLRNSDFNCHECRMQETDLLNYLKDYVKRLSRQ